MRAKIQTRSKSNLCISNNFRLHESWQSVGYLRWKYFKMQWTLYSFEWIFGSIIGHLAILQTLKTVQMNNTVDKFLSVALPCNNSMWADNKWLRHLNMLMYWKRLSGRIWLYIVVHFIVALFLSYIEYISYPFL